MDGHGEHYALLTLLRRPDLDLDLVLDLLGDRDVLLPLLDLERVLLLDGIATMGPTNEFLILQTQPTMNCIWKYV